jgi:predicted GH43/DUF377 family glycosyl hydrolase
MVVISTREVFVRHPRNPIITREDLPYEANSIFNAGAAALDGETVLLLRVEDRRGISHLTVARSKDGVSNWRIDTPPTLMPAPEAHPEEAWGIEDPRITYIEEQGRWLIAYTAYSESGPLVSLAATADFRVFERLGPITPPEDKDAALFPVRFDGRWAMIHRPVATFPAVGADMWISFSPDLKHWGDHQVLMKARRGAWWDAGKIGLSPPPLQTERGWLTMYHGVKNTPAGPIYRLGLALLDLHTPGRVLQRSEEWLFAPTERYERQGDVGAVVFPCGWVVEGNEVRMYYGAADTCVALATAHLPDLLDWLDTHDERHLDPIE